MNGATRTVRPSPSAPSVPDVEARFADLRIRALALATYIDRTNGVAR